MAKTVGIATLWFFTAWTAGSMVAFALSWPALIAPVAAVIAAAVVLRLRTDVRQVGAMPRPERVLSSH